MLSNFMMAILFIMAYYGIFCLIDLMDRLLKKKLAKGKQAIVHVLVVKNGEESLEYVLKELIENLTEHLSICDKIIIIDLNSQDGTVNILRQISNMDDRIEVLTYEEKDKLFGICEKRFLDFIEK